MRRWFAVALVVWPAATAARPRAREVGLGGDAQGRVVFTFDDGPNHATTPLLLDLLERFGIRAAFFVNGHRFAGDSRPHRKNRDALIEACRRGHLIGNHAFHHARLTELTPERQRWEILRNEEAILRVVGVRPVYFRPPYGRSTGAARMFMLRRGYTKVMWDIETRDHSIHDARSLAGRTVGQIRARNGGIVLFHDIHPWTVGAFEQTVLALQQENNERAARGGRPYRFVDPEALFASGELLRAAASAPQDGTAQ